MNNTMNATGLEILRSITADACVRFFLKKGTRVFYCDREGRSARKGMDATDYKGDTLILNGRVLRDVWAIVDVHSNWSMREFPEQRRETKEGDPFWFYHDATVSGEIYTPLIRDVIADQRDTDPAIYGKFSHEWRKARKASNAKSVSASGGYTPFVPMGWALVEDFRVDGTGYYLVPAGELV